MKVNLQTVQDWGQRLSAADSNKPLVLDRDGSVELLQPLGKPPGCWTRFKAALVNLPLIGRLDAVRLASNEVHLANRTYTELRTRPSQFRTDFEEELTRLFGEDIAHAAIDQVLEPSNRVGLPLTARNVVDILDRTQKDFARITTDNDSRISTRTLQVIQGQVDAFNLLVNITRMQAMAGQPAYFSRGLNSAEVDSAGALSKQLDELGLDRQVLASVVTDYTNRLESTPLSQKPQVAAAGIAACIKAYNRHTIGTQVMERAAESTYGAEPASGSSSSREAQAAPVDLIALLCADAVSPEAPLLTKQKVREAVDELERVRDTLRAELPDEIPEARLDKALESLSKGVSKLSSSQLLQLARPRILYEEFKRRFDVSVGDSDLCNVVVETAHGREITANSTALLGAIAKEMLNEVEERAASAPEHFQCESDLNVVFPIMHRELIQKTKEATAGHLDALQEIDQSSTFNPKQKRLLQVYAEGALPTYRNDVEVPGSPPHRLDATQLRQFQGIADTIAAQIPLMSRAIRDGEPAQVFDSMVRIEAAYSGGLQAIVTHAEGLWVSRSVFGSDKEQELFDLCVNLALAKNEEDLHALGSLAVAPGSAAQSSAAPANDPQHQRRADTVRQFRDACVQSSMGVDKLGRFYGDILRVAGVEPAADLELDVGAAPTQRQPLHLMQPELLVRTLGHSSCTLEEVFDERGVMRLDNSVAASRVDPDFRPAERLPADNYGVSLAGQDLSAGSTGDRLGNVLGFADIIINGRRLSRTGDDINTFIAGFDDERHGIELAAAASVCISSDTLRHFSDDVDANAFVSPIVPQAHRRPVYEVWRGEDGNWRVRSTRVSSPAAALAGQSPWSPG